jgi:hypothetical protein
VTRLIIIFALALAGAVTVLVLFANPLLRRHQCRRADHDSPQSRLDACEFVHTLGDAHL